MRLKNSIVAYMLLATCSNVVGQIDAYQYKRELSGITDTWHAVTIPDELYKNVKSDLSDIRMYGITQEGDTVEAPYVIKQHKQKVSSAAVNFEIINRTTNKEGSFITFRIPSNQVINQIQLFFDENNFDRFIKMEGSQNLKDWYTIVDKYRILSIKNELTNYSFTTIKFPDTKYAYFRVLVKGASAPKVKKAQITLEKIKEANYKEYTLKAVDKKENKKDKTTIIDIDLNTAVPISYIKIKERNDFDYYRPVSIEYLSDSLQTAKGWSYRYRILSSGILNSIEENVFRYTNVITSRIRVTISNKDNQPLDIDSIQIKGNVHELYTRFTTPAKYYLSYGNATMTKPSYDLQYLSDRIPENIKNISIGNEEIIKQEGVATVLPLFRNKMWLWGVMLLVILLLGGFTLSMMKKR